MGWGEGSYVSEAVKATVRRRDQTCQLAYPGICTGHIDEFDHPDGLAETGRQRNSVTTAAEVQGVCSPCHEVKTEQQRRDGIERARAQRGGLSKRLRDQEPHPGAL